MFHGGFDDEIWDEHKWEAHLDEIERKSEQLRKFIAPNPTGNIPRWLMLLQENSDELDAVDAFIEEELQFGEAYFPDDEDDWEDFDDELDDFFADYNEEDFRFFEDEEDDFDIGEEWKELSDEFTLSDYGSLDSLVIYERARLLAAHTLQWAEGIHPKYHTSHYNDFIGSVLKIGAKIAGGYSFGFEQEYLGGNIASTKKALYCANEALVLLQDHIKEAPYITKGEYGQFHMQLFELRNEIGIYIQELRERFNLGLE